MSHIQNKSVTQDKQTNIEAIPFILQKNYNANHSTELRMMMQSVSKKEIMDKIEEVKRQLNRPIVTIQKYAKTKHAAAYLDVDPSFLDKKRKSGIFKLGVHYHKPDGCNLVLWDIDALGQWATTVKVDNDNIDIIDNMFK